MCWQGSHYSCRPDIPEKYGLIVRATNKHVSFWRECQRIYVVVMSQQWYRVGFPLKNKSKCQFSDNDTSGIKLTVETSHNRIDLSSEPEANVFESGLQAIVEIPARWPSRMCNCFPVFVSHILIVASAADIFPHQPRHAKAHFWQLTAARNAPSVRRKLNRGNTSSMPFQH